MHKILISFLLIMAATVSDCFCQMPTIITLKGMVLNAATGEAIPSASIHISKNNVTTISNEKGGFIFKIPVENRYDSIHITHIGFDPVVITINRSDSGIRVIKLHEKIHMLADVVIMNPMDIIKKAISRIPENYPSSPYLMHGFYRVYGTKEKNVIDISEAVFDIYGDNYLSKNKQLKLIKARVDKDLTAFNGNDGLNFGAKPEGIFRDDIVSNATQSDLLSEEGLKNHQFLFNGIVDYDGKKVYEIEFDQKDGIRKSLNKGKLFIEVSSLAFLELDIQKSPKGLQYWEFGFVQRLELKLANIQVNLVGDSTRITYQKFGNRYYLNQISGTNLIHIVGGRKQFEIDPLRLKADFLITGIDTVDFNAFKKGEVLSKTKLIEEQAPEKNTDSTDSFWGNYNLIQSTFNVDSVAKIIRAKNETLAYKKYLESKLSKYKNDKAIRIDSILSFYHRKDQFTGTALIKYQGNTIYEKSFGFADIENNILNGPQTQFRIGSTSKQFTAMLIIQLVNENKLRVEDSVSKILPWYKNGNVTIRQLLTHQSGIPNYTDVYFDKIVLKQYTMDELVQNFCSDPLEFEPGTQFSYCNSGYAILADMIEKITGKKYGDVLKERIFDPLGMKQSYFGTVPHATSMAIGYINDQPEHIYPVENAAGAGAIVSTAEDLLLWHNALSDGTILPKDKIEELFKPRVEWKEYDAMYGYGWMIDKLQFNVSKKHIVQYHPGTEFGFYDMLVRQPDKDIFIILLNNKGDFPRFDMTDLILNELN